jgi:hypothetical protein
MTKSRMALALALLALPAVAPAQIPAPADPVAAQRNALRVAMGLDCPAGGEEEIVVCGSRSEERRQRVPMPFPRTPGPADRDGGEQLAAMTIGDDRCSPVGRDQQCNGGLDVIGIGFTIARAVVRAIADRD